MAIVITKENFEKEVMQSDKPVLVDFWAPWCGPCNMISPMLEEIENENPQYKIAKVNIDEQPDIAQQFGVRSIPTLISFEDGKKKNQSVGVIPKDQIVELLK